MARAKRAAAEELDEKVINLEGAESPEGEKKKKKKTGRKGRRRLIFLLVVIFAIGGFLFALVYFDLFGARTGAYEFLHNLDPEYRMVTEREAGLAEREAALEELQAQLEDAEAVNERKERELIEYEANLEALEINRLPVYRQPANDSDVEYMEHIGKIFASMDPQNAANILQSLYSAEDTAAVLYYMSAGSAGPVLELMEVEYAARVTDALLYD